MGPGWGLEGLGGCNCVLRNVSARELAYIPSRIDGMRWGEYSMALQNPTCSFRIQRLYSRTCTFAQALGEFASPSG